MLLFLYLKLCQICLPYLKKITLCCKPLQNRLLVLSDAGQAPSGHPEQRLSPRRCWRAWGPARVAPKLLDPRRVPGISFQPLNEDLIQLGGPGKEIKGSSHCSDPLTHTKAEAMAQTASPGRPPWT